MSKIVPTKVDEQLYQIRHSLAHVLAAAAQKLWPETKFAIGPVIDEGFYYDFDFGAVKVSEADFARLEAVMREIISADLPLTRSEMPVAQASARCLAEGQIYKQELVDDLAKAGETTVSFYQLGNFDDLCRGNHVASTGQIPTDGFALRKIAGAYWRGDETRPMLTRIYGLAFADAAGLSTHLTMLAEAEKRDHKKLGKELDLFLFSDLVGSGLPLWTPKGTLMRHLLDNFVWQLRQAQGYERVEIPHITKKDLYQTSGHWEKFQAELFHITTREGHEFVMKPMNCPHHTQIYARRQWSYRDLPQRYANSTACYRDEQSGELSGLARARSFTQDDAHVFCRPDQVKEEFLKIWHIIHQFYGAFKLDLQVRLSSHDPAQMDKYLGQPESWLAAEKVLREILDEQQVDYLEGVGEAAFYGPKLDFMAKDSLGRQLQVATIQLDMNMPERFDLFCINEQGQKERIVMIHAAIMGSIERFMSVLIEHYAGAFPLWLSPVQMRILPVAGVHETAATALLAKLQAMGYRGEIASADETLGNRIRQAVAEHLPYQIVLGDKEIAGGTLAIRRRGSRDLIILSWEEFLAELQGLVANYE